MAPPRANRLLLAAGEAETYVCLNEPSNELQLSARDRKMTHRHSRIVDWTKSIIIVLWFFSAPFLFYYFMRLFDEQSWGQNSSTLLYVLFFFGTWFWSFYLIYGASFRLADMRWPQNALRVRQIKETTDMVLRFLIFAPWGK